MKPCYCSTTYIRAHEGSQRVVWNVLTSECNETYAVNIDVQKYNIHENEDRTWMGDVITIFNKEQLGLYPYYNGNQSINGGLPQMANFSAHYIQMEKDITRDIPNASYDGLAVIDWEEWRPIWERNWDDKKIYQRKSESIVRQKHPRWSEKRILDEAKNMFTTFARRLMDGTLRLAIQIRPRAYWGFYKFPDCYNYRGSSACSNDTMRFNDQLMWLYNASRALYPSAYIDSQTTHSEEYTRVSGQVKEAQRIQKMLNTQGRRSPMYLYTRYNYSLDEKTFYSNSTLNNTIWQPLSSGLDGVVIWGNHDCCQSERTCESLRSYVDTTVGPFVRATLHAHAASREH